MAKYNVLDLFCGCGGLSKGFFDAGFNIVLGIDVWADAIKTYKLNHKYSNVICGDISKLSEEEIANAAKKQPIDIVIGGPPCQGFSIAGKRIIDDERNKLYKEFVRIVRDFTPKAFVLENVPNILSMGGGVVKDAIIRDFEKLGYKVVYKVLLASDYGVPQNRRRAFFVGLNNGRVFEFPKALELEKVTSKEAISDLPDYSVEDGKSYPNIPTSNFQNEMRKNAKGLYNHQITIHTEKTKSIIKLVPDGGNYKDLPQDLQKTRRVNIAWTRINSKKPSMTIDTGHNHHFHYLYNRVPTVRESARLQSFPDDFIFTCGKTSQLKQVGNAVPPILSHKIALLLKSML